MLPSLTRYLFRYKQVAVPSVGTIRLLRHPAVLSIADKIIEPPYYTLKVADEETVSLHQLAFLARAQGVDHHEAEQQLRHYGEDMHRQMEADSFDWPGLGRFSNSSDTLRLNIPSLEPVVAEKVIRQDSTHSVLVGDREMSSTQITSEKILDSRPSRRRSAWIVAGWVVLALSIVFIVVLLYAGKFRVNASGSKLPPLGSLPAVQVHPQFS